MKSLNASRLRMFLIALLISAFCMTGCTGCADNERHEVRYSADGKDSVVYVHYKDQNGQYQDFMMNYLLFQTVFGNGGSSGYRNVYNHYHTHYNDVNHYPPANRYSNYKRREDDNPYVSSKKSNWGSGSSSSSSNSSSNSYSSPSRSSGSSYSSPSRSSGSSSSRSSGSSYSSPSRSYSSPSRSYSSPSRSYSSPSRSYSSPSRH